jgi:formylglycine-generating enzyme required for sulfatase activity
MFAGWATTSVSFPAAFAYADEASYTTGSGVATVNLYAVWTIDMASIPAGNFIAGSDQTVEANRVTLTSGFYMGKYEVTQEQWKAVMTGSENIAEPSSFSSSPASGEVQEKRPVERVTWYDTIEFCNRLSEKEGLEPVYNLTVTTRNVAGYITAAAVTVDFDKNGYRLPTEAQWEYAYRAGTTTTYSFGASWNNDYGWISGNSSSMTHEVGKKLPNAWGLYDMHGNVYEWCWDWHQSAYPSSANDPTGAPSGSNRMLRGGSWDSSASFATSVYRNYRSPDFRGNYLGFRVLRPDN